MKIVAFKLSTGTSITFFLVSFSLVSFSLVVLIRLQTGVTRQGSVDFIRFFS